MNSTERDGPRPSREELSGVIATVAREAQAFLDGLDDRPARLVRTEDSLRQLKGSLPEEGDGAVVSLQRLIEKGMDAAVGSAGPRCFHFVIGGTTPAALGADWLATALDQMAYAWVSSPLATELEVVSLAWLRELFGLPAEWAGVMTTGATMANFVGLASARQWWGERQEVDIAERGLSGLPQIPVLTGGYIHASAVKSLSMLGAGRSTVRMLSRDNVGRLDVEAMEEALRDLKGAPAILIGNAGEVNAGDFDPIEAMADLADKYGAWLHVDGAFGLFARVSPQTEHLAAGAERAHSVAVDGHKWLNVPYDCGFGFVGDPSLLGRTFAYTAAYLPDPDDPRPNFGSLGPESSRRARSLPVWATLCAYGRAGYRRMVEGHIALAQRLGRLVDEAPDLERLAYVTLNIVCFRYNPGGLSEDQLNDLNERLGEAILADGRFYAGATQYGGKTALRPAIVNWRTREEHVDQFVAVVRELGAQIFEGLLNQDRQRKS